jgi:VIT1/CCC1 family predicted Fe2+/Mn2+ transporter
MKHSLKTGLGFGITSGVITTLGLLVGLHAGTLSKLAIIGGVLTIAIADAFSDSLGIHISKEFEDKASTREIWEATITTFLSKFLVAITFLIPVLIFSLPVAVKVSISWGMTLLGFFSFYIAKQRGVKAWPVIGEHLFIALVVILVAHYAGNWIRQVFV